MNEAAAPRVLLVDDDAEICDFLATLLELEGLRTEIATTPARALERFGDAAAVLVDVAMPGMDGLELTRRMRASGYRGPVLIVSARPGGDLPAKAAEAGASGFVRKPFENAELVSRVRALIAAA